MTLNQMASSSTPLTSRASLALQTIPLIQYHRQARHAVYPMTEEYSSISNVVEITSTVPPAYQLHDTVYCTTTNLHGIIKQISIKGNDVTYLIKYITSGDHVEHQEHELSDIDSSHDQQPEEPYKKETIPQHLSYLIMCQVC